MNIYKFNINEPLQGETQTNNRAELMAVLRVLQIQVRAVEIRSDSEYVVKRVNSNLDRWRSEEFKRRDQDIENADLWRQLDQSLASRLVECDGVVSKVKGHATTADVLKGKAV